MDPSALADMLDRYEAEALLRQSAYAGIKAGLAALVAGEAAAASALPPAELRAALGYDDYDQQAKRFITQR